MPTVVQFRRGTTAQNDLFTGAVGEVTVDTTKSTLRVHDGSTAGGVEILEKNLTNQTIGGDVIPSSTNAHDLGADATRWKDLYLSGSLTVAGDATIAGNLTFGDAATDTVSFSADVASDIIPSASSTYDIGASGTTFAEIHGDAIYGAVTGNVTGNADTATALETARTIGGVSFDGSANIDLPGVNTGGNQDTSGNAATATALETARTIGGVSFDGTADITLPGVNSTGNQDTSGNAATATALATARSIGGVSFDGTANITLPGVNSAGNQDTSGNAATATALATARTITVAGDVTATATSFDGSADITLTTAQAANSVDLGTHTTGNYVEQGATSGNGISGSVNSEGGTFTVTSNATNSNTGSTIVFRDGSGNFSAGTITASLTGNVTGNVASTGSNTMASLTTTGNVIVGGDLTVSGTTTTVDTETLLLADNLITLNHNETGTPSQDAGIEIERGTSTNKTLVWDETNDRWTVGTETFVASTFSGALSGNATTATTLQTARNIGGVSFDGSANINLAGVNTAGNQDTSGNAATATALETARTIGGVSFDGTANITLPGVNSAGNQNTSGNAATATTLQTARNIGGVSFNGSADINLPGVNSAGNQNTSGNAATATTWANGRTISLTGDVTGTSGSFNGSGNLSFSTSLAANTVTSSELSGATQFIIYNSAGTAVKSLFGSGS
jgi:hypothetical protein